MTVPPSNHKSRMSAELRNKIAALELKRDQEFAAKNEEILSLELKRDEDFAQMNKEIRKLELEAELAPLFQRVQRKLPVFSPVAAHDIKAKRLTVADTTNFISCSYQLNEDLTQPFTTKSETDFKAYVASRSRVDVDGAKKIGGHQANTITKFMKTGTKNIGDLCIVAYDLGCGDEKYELRRIVGPYRFAPLKAKTADRPKGFYGHQFPTEKIRDLTDDERAVVIEARKRQAPRGIIWHAEITI